MKRLLVAAACAAILFAACGKSQPTLAPPSTTSPAGDPAEGIVKSKDLKQGHTYWGVYLATGKPGSTKIIQAQGALAAYGIQAYPGSLTCDVGAAKQLGVDEGADAIAVYFKDEEQANAFAETMTPRPKGVVKVRVFCAD